MKTLLRYKLFNIGNTVFFWLMETEYPRYFCGKVIDKSIEDMLIECGSFTTHDSSPLAGGSRSLSIVIHNRGVGSKKLNTESDAINAVNIMHELLYRYALERNRIEHGPSKGEEFEYFIVGE